MTRVHFVCSQNKLRSPTAEQVFSKRAGFEVASAGTDLNKRVICLDIPDDFEFMDPMLVRMLEAKVGPFFSRGR